MPGISRRLVLLALLVLLLPGLALAEEKTFADQNFKLKASNAWTWHELSSDAESYGYVARLVRRAKGSTADVHIRVAPTNGLPMADLVQEVKDNLSANMTAVQGTKVMKGKLSGLECTVVLIKGLDSRDSHVLHKVFNLEAGDKFHQLMFRLIDGAETKQAKEVDALRRGYRLLKGAGPEEAEPEDLSSGGEDVEDDGEESEPERDGQSLTFPSHNVKWAIPAGSPFEWTRVARNEGIKEGLLCRAEATVEHPPKKGSEDEETQVNRAVMLMTVRPQPEGWTPKGVVNNSANHTSIEEDLFDKTDYGRMKIIDELPIGNYKGGAFQMVGTKEGRAVYFRMYVVGLKGEAYIIQVNLQGNRDVNDDFKGAVKDMLAGIEFIDTFVWARGPLAIQGVPSHAQPRGEYVDEEKTFTLMGLKATKPKGMAHLKFNPEHTGGSLRLAWEMRSEDKTAYFYIDVQSWAEKNTRRQRNFDEDAVKTREGQWKEHVESPTTVKKGKTPWFKSKFGKGRGIGYEFTGYLGEAPYMERGFVVKYKGYVYWVRYQLGGENAEKIFAKTVKRMSKALKFGG